MRSSLEQVLDTCVAQLNSGQDLEQVLATRPADADELRPMLAAYALMRVKVPPPTQKMARKSAFLASVEDRRRQVEVTEGYVVEMKAGVPLPELIARAAPGLRPLIRAAWRLFTTPPPVPSAERMAEGKARLMAMAEARRAARVVIAPTVTSRVRLAWADLWCGLHPRPSAARRAWSGAVALLITVIVLGAGAAGVGTAAASSLPGDSLYEFKEFGRSAQILFAFDPARRAELHLRFGQQRLSEMETLARAGRTVPVELIEAWLGNQSRALADIQSLPYDQRQRMAMLWLAQADAERVALRLRDALDDPGHLARLLARSGELVAAAKVAAGESSGTMVPVAPVAADPGPLPDELAPRPRANERSDGTNDPAAAPRQEPPQVVDPVSAPPAVAIPPAPQHPYIQPGGDERTASRRDEERGDDPGAGAPASATGPVATATEPPPAYNQPIFEEPTDTPELPPLVTPVAPGGGDYPPTEPPAASDTPPPPIAP